MQAMPGDMKSAIEKKKVAIFGGLVLAAASVGSAYLHAFGAPAPATPLLSSSPSLSDFVEAQHVARLLPKLLTEPPQTISADWCKNLPRPEYKTLERVLPNESWFEVYRIRPGVFAIYEPHQAEEVISYLIVGTKQALLFDTGMGIANIHKVVTQLTSRPVVVLNSHTHNDHVGGNYLFPFVFGMDTAFTRQNAKGSRDDAQEELAPGMLCGELPKGFDTKGYATKPWHISLFVHDGFKINLGAGHALEIIATPGHTPDSIALFDRENGLLFTGDTYYPGPIWLFRPETDLDAYVASAKKLAALEPDVKLVLGAHNVPVADPAILEKLPTAIEDVRAGKVEGKSLDGPKTSYTVEGITFLLRSGPQGVK
jgi:glyoxylase-like metal-dependent hydrolase (beta-lactamase superfamily II)